MHDLFAGVYRGKRCFVTGHTGFKGSWLSVWLKSLGAQVCGYALAPNTNPSHFEALDLRSLITSHIADLRTYAQLKKSIDDFKPEIVFHLAAQALVRDSYRNPLETVETNVQGTANLLQACRDVPGLKAVLIITSDKCYRNEEWERPYREDDHLGGHDLYSASKACAELITSSFRDSFFAESECLVASVRAGNVIGGGDWSAERLLPDLMRAAFSGQIAQIRNAQAVRPWQHVLEPLLGYMMLGARLLKGERRFAAAFNFGPDLGASVEVQRLVEIVQHLCPKLKVEFVPDKKMHEAGLLRLDSTLARNELGWRPVLTLEQALDFSVRWFTAFYEEKKALTSQSIADFCEQAEKVIRY